MAIRPEIRALTNTAPQVLNAIRNDASQSYRDYVPFATADASSVKAIGSIIMDHVNLRNEFINALVNRISAVLVTSKMYTNPWSVFKRGVLEMGETIEEIFVNLAKPFQYDPEVAESTVFKREIPDIKAAFHPMNYQKYYKNTINNDQLRQAFLTWGGVTDLIARIVDSMYSAAAYDEFLTMKYMLAKNMIHGKLVPHTVPYPTDANMRNVVAEFKAVSNAMEFMSSDYNQAGVATFLPKSDQYLIVSSRFQAIMDVEVLATSFNMDKAEFMGHVVMVDSFGSLDTKRLSILFADDPNYEEFSATELGMLNEVPAVLVDKNWFMIYDNMNQFTTIYNAEGLYWNYFYHTWKTFSVSPFSNAVALVPATPAITTVTVSPSTATVAVGSGVQLTANVTSANLAPEEVVWSSSSENVIVDQRGYVTRKAAGSATITATSVYDNTKKGTSTIS